MLEINKDKLKNYTRVEIINLMNSITGAKPALLLGTKSISKVSNLAIFSSIVHISSSPALFAFFIKKTKISKKKIFDKCFKFLHIIAIYSKFSLNFHLLSSIEKVLLSRFCLLNS